MYLHLPVVNTGIYADQKFAPILEPFCSGPTSAVESVLDVYGRIEFLLADGLSAQASNPARATKYKSVS